jgi:hypothetical protein
MWENLKKQIIEKIINEIKSVNNWDKLDNIILNPFLKRFRGYINIYLYFFISINTIIILLLIINIFLIIYYKKI